MNTDSSSLAIREKFERYHASKDVTLRDELFLEFRHLLRPIVARFMYRGQMAEDLLQAASMGLVHAIERFDPQRGTEFVSFATPTIIGELKRYLRDSTWFVRVPRQIQERRQRIQKAIQELTHHYGRAPTIPEISRALSLSEEDILEALEADTARTPISLSATLSTDESATITPIDLLPAQDFQSLFADRLDLMEAVRSLPPDEQRLISLRFFEGYSQMEIAEVLGISQMHVSRLLRKALQKLKEIMV